MVSARKDEQINNDKALPHTSFIIWLQKLTGIMQRASKHAYHQQLVTHIFKLAHRVLPYPCWPTCCVSRGPVNETGKMTVQPFPSNCAEIGAQRPRYGPHTTESHQSGSPTSRRSSCRHCRGLEGKEENAGGTLLLSRGLRNFSPPAQDAFSGASATPL